MAVQYLYPKSASELAGDKLIESIQRVLPHIRECPDVVEAKVVPTYNVPMSALLRGGGRFPLAHVDIEVTCEVKESLTFCPSVDFTAIAQRLGDEHPAWGRFQLMLGEVTPELQHTLTIRFWPKGNGPTWINP